MQGKKAQSESQNEEESSEDEDHTPKVPVHVFIAEALISSFLLFINEY